eukprot:jgi/Botrbrau1/16934/Bobra.49_2s0003.1
MKPVSTAAQSVHDKDVGILLSRTPNVGVFEAIGSHIPSCPGWRCNKGWPGSCVWAHPWILLYWPSGLPPLCVEEGCEVNDSTLAAAASAGQIKALEYLRQKGVAWSTAVTAAAARTGQLQMLQFLHARGCPWNYQNYIQRSLWGSSRVFCSMHSRKGFLQGVCTLTSLWLGTTFCTKECGTLLGTDLAFVLVTCWPVAWLARLAINASVSAVALQLPVRSGDHSIVQISPLGDSTHLDSASRCPKATDIMTLGAFQGSLEILKLGCEHGLRLGSGNHCSSCQQRSSTVPAVAARTWVPTVDGSSFTVP